MSIKFKETQKEETRKIVESKSYGLLLEKDEYELTMSI